MRTIIAGSRDFLDYARMEKELEHLQFEVTVVLCGMAAGADQLGRRWAAERNIPVEYYPADWKTYGRSAGPVRNVEMADKADMLIAFWDGKSSGTEHMIETAIRKGLETVVVYTNAS